ncbi:hypothetical protein WJX74_001832 [Apatococcus lobatus]|uniref:Uncharacterized protein n=1 Tax=Apatococcus lobatus TaxID=904363 RepID=A0AAW1QMA1_9CHLO
MGGLVVSISSTSSSAGSCAVSSPELDCCLSKRVRPCEASSSNCNDDSQANSRPEKRVPPGLAWNEPFRFGPFCRPSEEDLDKASALARARKSFTSALETQKSLKALLSYQDWRLLQWTHRQLLLLAAQEGIGPHSLHTAAKSPELQRLMKR